MSLVFHGIIITDLKKSFVIAKLRHCPQTIRYIV